MNRLEKILQQNLSGGPGHWKKLYDDIDQLIKVVCQESLVNAAQNVSVFKSCRTGESVVNMESIVNKNNISKL